ncbi:MAG: hypothetical protein RBR95_09970 [Ignavibacteriaceae bacterium]|jgi:hypothetical protein|nr:hypothetical protein [Ignavibacteriaceae bacterium]
MTLQSKISVIEKELSYIRKNLDEMHSLLSTLDSKVDRLESFKNKIYGAFILINLLTAFIIAALSRE